MIGFDFGSYHLVATRKDKDGNYVHNKEVNAFIKIPLKDRFVFNMMKNAGVPIIEKDDNAYVLGESAVSIASTIPELELHRPMKDGCVNPNEKDAFEILNIMTHSLLDGIGVDRDKANLYYCIPANAINRETDADYHKSILQSIFKSYVSPDGHVVTPFSVNEALALIYAECEKQRYTAIGCSFGSGLINVCFAIFGNPVFSFSIANSGDWIDKQSAKASGESVAFINQEKMKIDLSKQPTNVVERAISTQYKIMIEKTINSIKNGLEMNSKKLKVSNNSVDMVVAGGTSMVKGFDKIFMEILESTKLPVSINTVIRPKDPLFAVARGCCLCAELAV